MTLYAELAFINGNFLTLEDTMPHAQALAVRDGNIIVVGTNDQVQALCGPATEVVDFAGKTLLPGFIDAHTHLMRTGMERTLYLDLDTPSLDALLDIVTEAARQRAPGQWVVGRGWDESGWNGGAYPSKADLDRAAPEHPAVLIRVCGHIVCVNSQALEAVPVLDDPATVDRKRGWLREESAWRFLDQIEPDLDERVAALKAGIAHAHACGITSIHEIADAPALEAYAKLHREAGLGLRVRLNLVHHLFDPLSATGLRGEFGDGVLTLGALKLFADGSIGARNAALFDAYEDDAGNRGALNFKQADLEQWMRKGVERGYQLMTHAIGDRAIEAVLDAYEAVGVAALDRPRIEHLEMPTEAQLERMARRGVIASMQPNFLQWSGPGKLYEQRLGADRDAAIDPHRRVLDAGVPLTFSSDSMPVNPLYGMHLAVNAPHEGQRLTVEEALKAYTLDGAYAGFLEDRVGSLKAGKWADLVVLDRDPTEAQQELGELEIDQVFLGGKRVK